MKKPIDPNLENITDEDFLLNAEELSRDAQMQFTQKPDETPAPEPEYVVKEAEESTSKADYFASEHHKQQAERGTLNEAYKQMRVGSDEHSHHHSSHGDSHHSSSHHSSSHHHHSSSHHHHHHKKKKPLAVRIAVAILIILLVIILAGVGTFVALQQKGKSDLKNTTAQTNYQEVIEYNGKKYVYNNNIVSIAFLGVDKRELGLDDDTVGTAGQADADIVFTVDTSTGVAKALAIPRDTMVDVDLYSDANIFLRTENMQLCLSYAYGNGTDTSATNVTTSISRILYNVPINKYFALDLDGIKPINDAIGGVDVESLYDFDELGIKKGDTIHLQGDLTETYVRTRSLDNVEASLNRTARQVQYVKAFANQLAPAVASDFSVITNLYNTASSYSTTNLSLSNVTYLGSLLLYKGVTSFESYTLEGEMKMSDKVDYADYVYAEFYPDEDKLMQTVLDIFYVEAD